MERTPGRGQDTCGTGRDATVRLVADALFRESMAGKLKRVPGADRFRIRYRLRLHARSGRQVVLLQAELWERVKGRLGHATPVVFVGSPARFHCWLETAGNRPSAYLTPFDPGAMVVKSLEGVLAGDHLVSKAIGTLLEARTRERQQILLKEHIISHLTPSELEILWLIGEGYSTSEIAAIRDRSVHTVKTQRKRIRQHLGLEYGERLGTFAGRKLHGLKTLSLMKKKAKLLSVLFPSAS